MENPTIRHFGTALAPPPYAAGAAGRPLVNLTLAANYALGGLAVPGYRAANLLLHFLAAWTLCELMRRTLRRRGAAHAGAAALAAAGIWAVHPLLTESVMGVIQRNEILASLCLLLTLLC
ncbi:MAG TPA: hypothetical protein VHV47_11090, partial [Opitutaceae bacterium]|nr:hypothetical protein [Opitutaceae bacterium]